MAPTTHTTSTTTTTAPAWLGVSAAAARMGGVANQTVRNLIRDGELPAVRIRNVLRIRTADIDRFMEAAATAAVQARVTSGPGAA